jgi:hypothetical protein
MTKEQEDKIIARAQDILERRMAVEKDIKINLQNLVYYGAYYQGAIMAVKKITDSLLNGNKPKKDDWIYFKAEWDLITSSKRNMQLYLDGTEIRYRNHKRNKKGKLESVECYFVEQRNVIMEVK